MIVTRKQSQRGAVLIWVLALVVISGILLNVMASHAGRATESSRKRMDAEAALLEARGGVREGAFSGPFVRADADGTLRVEVEGERLRATYAWKNGISATVSARWNRGEKAALSDWRED